MRAVDTNVVARYLIGNDSVQLALARLIEGEPVRVGVTVMIELEWVLRRVAGIPKPGVIALLSRFAGLPTVHLEDAEPVAQALEWAAGGLDFADALHLARAQDSDGFATFDRELVRLADVVASVPVATP